MDQPKIHDSILNDDEKCIAVHSFNLSSNAILITVVSEIIHHNCLSNLINKHLIKPISHTDIH